MEPIIEFKDYSFKYRAQKEPTLKNINLKIYPGEKVLIVGPSGSGKSTLAHCLNGLVPFSYPGECSGSLKIKGKDPREEGIFGMSKLVGTVLQDTDGQFIGLTVAEDIAFALENECTSQKEMHQSVEKTAQELNLEDLLDHAPGELSGGQKQRVSMAGVMIDRVEILLFDEPLANLDPASGKRTIDLIDRIQKNDYTTIVIIEHRLEDVLYRDVYRIIVIGDGKIAADMTPDALLTTSVLEAEGIREPLYLTACKYMNIPVLEERKPQHVETFDLTGMEGKAQKWYQEAPVQSRHQEGETLLELQQVGFGYLPGQQVLQNISFQVKKGEMLSIVGKNGAGKSTMSSLICGFLTPTEGHMIYRGQDMKNWSIKERGEKIGFVMQSPNQMISKPMIFDEVALGLVIRQIPEAEIKERVNQVLKICGLYEMRNWPVSALSFGQKKRVTIASILVMEPEMMILDEPTAGQDYRHYTEIMEFLKRLNQEAGITIMMITHDMHLMLEYTDRAIVLADGQILADDTPAAILTNEELAQKANLKKTSLYDLAVKCGITDVSGFVERFIQYERKERRDVQNSEV